MISCQTQTLFNYYSNCMNVIFINKFNQKPRHNVLNNNLLKNTMCVYMCETQFKSKQFVSFIYLFILEFLSIVMIITKNIVLFYNNWRRKIELFTFIIKSHHLLIS